MKGKDILEYTLEQLKAKGVDKVQCMISNSEKKELNIDAGEMSLFRTTFNTSLGVTVYKDGKKGSTSINKTDKNSIDDIIGEVLTLAESSQPDPAYDIAEHQEPRSFSCGNDTSDMDTMFDRLSEFSEYTKSTYPKVILEQAIMDFTHRHGYFMNSNGVDFELDKGMYGFSPMFTSKDGLNTSSFNYSGFVSRELKKPLHEYASIDRLLRESEQQVITSPVPGKFIGDIIVTPDCLDEFVGEVLGYVTDMPMITGRSIYKDKLNEAIADSRFTLHSKPLGDEIESKSYITSDGYAAENFTYIDKGVLKSFLLGIYGANKTGHSRSVNDGNAHVVEAGDVSLENMIKSVKKGVVLARFSGGNPSDNGDFSGVAKNSYFVENGEVKYPISETMISGNISEMMKSIVDISKERVDFGNGIYPWVQFNGLTIF